MGKSLEELEAIVDSLSKLLLGSVVNDTFQPGLIQQVISMRSSMDAIEVGLKNVGLIMKIGIGVLLLHLLVQMGINPEVIKTFMGLFT